MIDDAPGLTAAELEARCCMIKAKFEQRGTPLSCVFVDHLHKMNGPKGISPVQKFTEISAAMAEMAKRLSVPVWCLAQLNRSPESRDNKRPQLADLRESGAIEQDADVVLFIYRDDYYLARQRTDGDGAAEVARLRSRSRAASIL